MGRTTLYGVNENNELTEIYELNNGMAACIPIWNYLDKKYFPKRKQNFTSFPCWNLTPKTLLKEEFFALLSSFDGYYFYKKDLPQMIDLLKITHLREENPIRSTRLQIFEEALKNKDYDKFFITATSVADYEDYIQTYFDEETWEEYAPSQLKDTVWDIWQEYLEGTKQEKIAQPECNLYYYGKTEEEYINTLKAVFTMNPVIFSNKNIETLEEVEKYAKDVYTISCDEEHSGFKVLHVDGDILIAFVEDLTFYLSKRLEKNESTLINCWNEEGQQFKTVDIREIV